MTERPADSISSSETGDSSDRGDLQHPSQMLGQTRRRLLSSLVGALTFGGATGVKRSVGSKVPEKKDVKSGEMLQKRSVEQTNSNCPPTEFFNQWVSRTLGPGRNSFKIRPGSSSDEPVYVFGSDPTNPRDGGQIYGLNRDTGEVMSGWPVETESEPVIELGDGNYLFYATQSAITGEISLIGADAEDGTTGWSEQLPPSIAGVDLHYDSETSNLHAVTDGPLVTVVNADTGGEEWELSVDNRGQLAYSRKDGLKLFVSSNKFDPESGRSIGQLSAVNLEPTGGELLWTATGDSQVAIPPVVGEGFVSTGYEKPDTTRDNTLVTLDIESGSELWSDSRDDELVYGPELVSNGSALYAPAYINPDSIRSDGVLVKFEGTTGDKIWEVDADGLIKDILIDDTRVYLQTRPGEVVSINNQSGTEEYGEQVWKTTLVEDESEGIRDGGFTLECGTIYTGTDDDPGTVYAIDSETGTVTETFNVNTGVVKEARSQEGSVWATSGVSSDERGDTRSANQQLYKLSDPPDNSVSVNLTPESTEMRTDGRRNLTISVEDAAFGVESYDISIFIDNPEVIQIAELNFTKDPEAAIVSEDGSSVSLDVDMGLNRYEERNVSLVEMTIVGESPGSTDVDFTDVELTAVNGREQEVDSITNASISVAEGPPVIGDQPPQDLNGDGLYRDVDGDGEFTLADVNLFFENINSEVVRNSVEYFDYNGDGQVDIDDVRRLFGEYLEQSTGTALGSDTTVSEMSAEEFERLFEGL